MLGRLRVLREADRAGLLVVDGLKHGGMAHAVVAGRGKLGAKCSSTVALVGGVSGASVKETL